MKTINFVFQYMERYSKVLEGFATQITQHLTGYKCSNHALEDALNVWFFVESQPQGGVFIPHGIADKNYRNAERVRCFDYVFVSGPLWIEKLVKQGFPREKIVVAGYPKLDPIFKGEIKKRPGSKKRVLWAPTHGTIPEVSTYPGFEKYIDKFPSDFEVITSLHPAEKGGHDITLQLLADADVVIGDSGSISYEAMALGKPVIYPDWLIKEGIQKHFNGSFEDMILTRGIGCHADNFDHLIKLTYYAVENPMDPKTREFIDGIFSPELRGKKGGLRV